MAATFQTRICLAFLVVLAHVTYCPVTGVLRDSNYYTAAVVEFTPSHKWGNNGTLTLRDNYRAYLEYIKEASKQNADIIVFPEDGLTSLYMPHRSLMDSWATVIPSVLDNYVPCTQNTIQNVSETLTSLSCAARQNRIYVVVNIAEKEFCKPNGKRCSDGVSYHNTNVVFDRTGKIVARYRKVNLYMEYNFDPTPIPEVITFDTDFGVKFGTFICFDILFPVPALNLTRTLGISNFVYSTAWFSEMPYLTAVQTQFGWSFAENVNLLVSGYHEPKNGNAGSGIYLGRRGMAVGTITASPEHRLLIARVPKRTQLSESSESSESSEQNEVCEWKLHERRQQIAKPNDAGLDSLDQTKKLDTIRLLHDDLTKYKSVLLNASLTEQLCYGDFCCDFDVRKNSVDSGTSYRAVVYDGVRLYGRDVHAGIRVCSVLQCYNDSIYSCGFPRSSDTAFTVLNITATYDNYHELLVMPTVLDRSLLPMQRFTYSELVNGNQARVSIALDRSTKNLLTFGLYARDFSRDRNDRP